MFSLLIRHLYEMTLEEFKINIYPVKDKIFRFAKRILNNQSEAEDIVQEIFLKLWKLNSEIQILKNPEAFAMKMTKNLCLDRIKMKKEFTPDYKFDSSNITGEHDFEKKDMYNKIHEIIQTLPEQQKMIIQLRDIEGFTYDEIENIMMMNRNALRANLCRARAKIREKLLKLQQYEERIHY